MKKDNKGFSLVELIVVVLIMGILAVALTPQVLKWVNNSRIANDFQLAGNMETAAEVALTNETASGMIPDTGNITIEVVNNGSSATTWTGFNATLTAAETKFQEKFLDTLGETAIGNVKFSSPSSSVAKIKIIISNKGKVTTEVWGSSKISSPDT